MNITDRIVQLKLNVKQHQAQIKILYGEIEKLETFKSNNSVENVENDNIPNDNDNSNVDVFCFDKVIKPSKKKMEI
jgi:hypothetical protein